MTVFFDCCAVVHYEFLPTGQTVNKNYYLSILHHLRSHSVIISEFLNKHSTNTAPKALYSPDMALCDFSLFEWLKLLLSGHCFKAINMIKEN